MKLSVANVGAAEVVGAGVEDGIGDDDARAGLDDGISDDGAGETA
jgi:hypothetical protein